MSGWLGFGGRRKGGRGSTERERRGQQGTESAYHQSQESCGDERGPVGCREASARRDDPRREAVRGIACVFRVSHVHVYVAGPFALDGRRQIDAACRGLREDPSTLCVAIFAGGSIMWPFARGKKVCLQGCCCTRPTRRPFGLKYPALPLFRFTSSHPVVSLRCASCVPPFVSLLPATVVCVAVSFWREG